MTNKEAIANLNHIYGIVSSDIQRSLDIAIMALEDKPKGEWIEGENGSIKCNQCGTEIIYSYLIGNKPDFPNFCCDCGADMRGEEE